MKRLNSIYWTLAEERLMLGLRTIWGISPTSWKSIYSYEFSENKMHVDEKAQQEGFIQPGEDLVRLTKKGA